MALFNSNDLVLHFEAYELIKLLALVHGLDEVTLVVVISILRGVYKTSLIPNTTKNEVTGLSLPFQAQACATSVLCLLAEESRDFAFRLFQKGVMLDFLSGLCNTENFELQQYSVNALEVRYRAFI